MSLFNLFKSKPAASEQKEAELSWFGRLKQGLQKTRNGLASGLKRILGQKISEETLEELETLLLSADLGLEVTQGIIDDLNKKLGYHELNQPEALYQALKKDLTEILIPCEKALNIDEASKPYVILMVGVNGAGKTTTIGKLAKRLQQQNKTVMLAAGDTFRAAAVEQLQVWGERNNIPVIAQHAGADSASVLYDALQSAKAKGIDVLIADTAGRLHTKQNLMEELKKLIRVMQKIDPNAPHEVMLVLDAGMGQNALSQAKQFHEAVQITGISLTKLDGTAKGGIIFAIAKKLNLPIRFIGVGEAIDDLRPFNAEEFVEALFD
ncbi:MAG: signal recognition particle-docking protein FtsY [Gammaproteobacteria bacterium]|jgi:fused signal recognition particle receptor|nr:signal recognition particle-docking protein FtsY [Gammaproteobacteria bacterium]